LRTAGRPAVPPDVFATGGFFAAVFAAAGFGAGFAGVTDLREPDDFNVFEGGLCDAWGEAPAAGLVGVLADFFAGALRAFAAGVFGDVFDRARVAFPEEVLGDFLRVFLDIRLPFVAFDGSTITDIAARVRGRESSR
jgi:hypothetical protein